VSGCTALTGLNCEDNRLTALDVSKNTALQWLVCDSNRLTALDVSKNTVLEGLYCYSNQLQFSTLRLPSHSLSYLSFGSQQAMPISIAPDNIVNLSSEYLGGTTTYTWYSNNLGELVSGIHYAKIENGVFVFLDLQNGDRIYCRMTNPGFPDMTLSTSQVTIKMPLTQIPVNVVSTGADYFELTLNENDLSDQGLSTYSTTLQYRAAGTSIWTTWKEYWQWSDGDERTAVVAGLNPNTLYEFQLITGEDKFVLATASATTAPPIVVIPPTPGATITTAREVNLVNGTLNVTQHITDAQGVHMYKITVSDTEVGKAFVFTTSQPNNAWELNTYLRVFDAWATTIPTIRQEWTAIWDSISMPSGR